MSSLEISLLGTFYIRAGGTAISQFHSCKVRALLAYLAIEADRPHTRTLLAELLWPNVAAPQALGHLRKAAHHLVRAFDAAALPVPLLLSDHWGIRLNPDVDCTIDVAHFQQLITEVRTHCGHNITVCQHCATRLHTVVALYSGEFLAGFTELSSLAFEEWLSQWRGRLNHQFIEALTWLAGYHETQAEPRIAISYLRRWLEVEPWNEEAHRWLITVLARDGQRSAALHQFELCQRALAAEFKSAPTPQTIALYHAIQHRTTDNYFKPYQK